MKKLITKYKKYGLCQTESPFRSSALLFIYINVVRKAKKSRMITKKEVEQAISDDFQKVMKNETIFKYSDFDTAIDKIIIGQTLMFSHPNVFNDPFDCNEYLLKIGLTEKLIEETLKNVMPDAPAEWQKHIVNRLNNPDNVAETIREQKDKFKITCFSEKSDEVLMWSHYANKHSGICIGFNFPQNEQNEFILCGVKYLNEIKPLDGRIDFIRTLLYWLTSKSERWTYEGEVRAILQGEADKSSQIVNFNGANIREIIFGCNVTEDKIEDALIKISGTNLKIQGIIFKRMLIDKNTFLLKEERIKPSAQHRI